MIIFQRSNSIEFRKQIAVYLGKVNSIHTTPKHLGKLLFHLLKNSKYLPKEREEDDFLARLEILEKSISGESIRSFYYFPGTENAYIRLITPIYTSHLGICWTGKVRLEKGRRDKRQCILSLVSIQPNEAKGIELYVYDRKLIYHLVHIEANDKCTDIVLPDVEVIEDQWHTITFYHYNKELIVYVDNFMCKQDVGMQTCLKEYDIATIGASIDPHTNLPAHHFLGEISTLYFFYPSSKFKEAISDIARKGNFLPLLYKTEGIFEENFSSSPEYAALKSLKFSTKEFISSTLFVLDPNVYPYAINIVPHFQQSIKRGHHIHKREIIESH